MRTHGGGGSPPSGQARRGYAYVSLGILRKFAVLEDSRSVACFFACNSPFCLLLSEQIKKAPWRGLGLRQQISRRGRLENLIAIIAQPERVVKCISRFCCR
jgi:hypothetical protein